MESPTKTSGESAPSLSTPAQHVERATQPATGATDESFGGDSGPNQLELGLITLNPEGSEDEVSSSGRASPGLCTSKITVNDPDAQTDATATLPEATEDGPLSLCISFDFQKPEPDSMYATNVRTRVYLLGSARSSKAIPTFRCMYPLVQKVEKQIRSWWEEKAVRDLRLGNSSTISNVEYRQGHTDDGFTVREKITPLIASHLHPALETLASECETKNGHPMPIKYDLDGKLGHDFEHDFEDSLQRLEGTRTENSGDQRSKAEGADDRDSHRAHMLGLDLERRKRIPLPVEGSDNELMATRRARLERWVYADPPSDDPSSAPNETRVAPAEENEAGMRWGDALEEVRPGETMHGIRRHVAPHERRKGDLRQRYPNPSLAVSGGVVERSD